MSLSKARSRLLRRLQQRRHRRREGCFVVEGVRGAAAALEAGAPVRFAVTSPRLAHLDGTGYVQQLLTRTPVEVVTVDDEVFEQLSGTVTPQGVLLVCEELDASLEALADGAATGVLIADEIRDPSNLATMIRTAAAFGMAGLVALDGTVDAFNAKVVRGTAGACFRLPIVEAEAPAALRWLEAGKVTLLAAAPDGTDVAAIEVPGRWALAIGNEGSGLRPALRDAARAVVAVPILPEAGSLNAGVAAAVLCYELTRGARDRGIPAPTAGKP